MALVRTDYGLIYNTDGSLCATLLPEGGVAVTEGTTNGIQNGNFATGDFTGWAEWNPANGHKSIVTRDGINYARIVLTSDGESFGIQSTKNITVAVGDKVTVSFRVRGEKPNYAYLTLTAGSNINISSFIQYTDLPNGESIGEYTWTAGRAADVGFLFGYAGTPKSGEFTYAQLEKKPYRTPFVDGTRPAGQLSIPLVRKQHSAGNITLSTTITCNGDDYYVGVSTILRVINTEASNAGFYITGTGPSGGNKLKLSYMLGGQLRDLYVGISAKNGIKQKLTLVVDGKKVYLYQDGSLLWSGTVPEGGTAVTFNRVQFMGVKSQTYENTLISPSVVSPETVATWHSLDAPFFDPREITTAEIDATKRTIYAPGVIIDSTGAWGIANGIKQAGFGTDGKWVAGGGSVVADETGLKIISQNGDYSLMDANQLRFFKNGYDVPYWYAKRVTYGIAEDGDYIDLTSETGVPWDRAPKVITAINSLISYNPASSHAEQHFEAYVDGVTNEGFYVYCKNVIPATWSNWNDQNITLQPSYTTGYTPTSVTELEISINSGRIGTWVEYPPMYSIYQHYITIAYQKLGGSWVTYFQGYPGGLADPNYADKNYTYHISGLEPGQYRVSVSGQTGSGVVNYAKLNGWRYRNVSTVNTGRVMWIAIEGGAS